METQTTKRKVNGEKGDKFNREDQEETRKKQRIEETEEDEWQRRRREYKEEKHTWGQTDDAKFEARSRFETLTIGEKLEWLGEACKTIKKEVKKSEAIQRERERELVMRNRDNRRIDGYFTEKEIEETKEGLEEKMWEWGKMIVEPMLILTLLEVEEDKVGSRKKKWVGLLNRKVPPDRRMEVNKTMYTPWMAVREIRNIIAHTGLKERGSAVYAELDRKYDWLFLSLARFVMKEGRDARWEEPVCQPHLKELTKRYERMDKREFPKAIPQNEKEETTIRQEKEEWKLKREQRRMKKQSKRLDLERDLERDSGRDYIPLAKGWDEQVLTWQK